MPPEPIRQKYTVPAAIVGAGLLLAVAVYLYNAPINYNFFGGQNAKVASYTPPQATDHLLGNPGAPIKLIEYCDIAVPYCVQFQSVMNSIMASYGASGQVAWIYRHLPLVAIDPKEKANLNAAECAAQIGGSNAFFGFVSAIATTTKPAPDYLAVATKLKLSASDFNTCITSNKFDDMVTTDYQEAATAGATGAPFTIILVSGHEPISIAGSISYAEMRQIIEQARTALNAK
jgi:protein-disulfide isomerase